MKRLLSLLLVLFITLPLLGGLFGGAAGADPDAVFAGQVADMVFGNWEDGFFSTITLTAGEPEMTVDGETVSVEPPEADGDDVALPVLEIAEVVGAEVTYDEQTGQLTVSDDGERKTVTARKGGGRGSRRVRARELSEALDLDIKVEGDRIQITRPYQTKRLIVYMLPGYELKNSRGAKQAITDGQGMYLLQYDSRRKTRQAEAALDREPGVESVWPDIVIHANSLGWGTGRVYADQMTQHIVSQGGDKNELIVAVADTGVDTSHPFFRGRLKTGFNFTAKNTAPLDKYGHGTHVSGTIVDCTPQNVKVMPLKILDDWGWGTESIAGLGVKYAADNGAKVVNMSLGFGEDPKYDTRPCPLKRAIDYAEQKGTICVAAAGNNHYFTDHICPARHDNVITVAAVDEDDDAANFSNFGESVDIAAPGVYVRSAVPGGGYEIWNGTSMASPHVAAGVALLMLNEGGITNAASVKAALKKVTVTPDDWNTTLIGWEYGDEVKLFGEGILDFRKLLGVTNVPAAGAAFWGGDGHELDAGLLGVKKFELPVSVRPGNATDKKFTVVSSDPSVAYWDDGFVHITGKGTATLTATPNDTTGSPDADTFTVTVNPSNCWIDYAAASFSGGDGSESNPYQISSAEELAKLAYDLRANIDAYAGKHFLLTDDIDLSGHSWGPIGYNYVQEDIGGTGAKVFTGHFDGGCHVIKNLTIPPGLRVYHAGLFGLIADGSVKNLGIENADIHTIYGLEYIEKTFAGILAAFVQSSEITRCYADRSSCYNAGNYKGCYVNQIYKSEIHDCFTAGMPFFSQARESLMYNCYTPSTLFGGLVDGGEMYNTFSAHYARADGGGFLYEYKDNGVINNCFFLSDVPSYVYYGKKESIFDKAFNASIHSKPLSFFQDTANYALTGYQGWHEDYPWDFSDVWDIDPNLNDGLPYLKKFAAVPANREKELPEPPAWVDPKYIIRGAAPYESCFIDLQYEDLYLDGFFTGGGTLTGYSLDGGKSWKFGVIDASYLCKKGGTLAVTNRLTPKKRPSPEADTVYFPKIEKRPKAPPKLTANYVLKADPTGQTPGGWVLTKPGETEPVTEGYEMAEYAGNKGGYKKMPGSDWLPIAEYAEGIEVWPFFAQKWGFVYRTPPVVGDKIIPGSAPLVVEPKRAGKIPKYKADYKKETIKLKAGATIYGGSYSEMLNADMDDPNIYAASAADFGPGKLYVYKKSDKGVNLSAMLDKTKVTDVDGLPVTAAVCIWSPATAKAPASDVQEYTLAVRADLPGQTIEGARLPKNLEVFYNGKWGSPPKVKQTTVLSGGVRLKTTAKTNKYDDSAQLAASVPKDLTIEYGAGGVARFIVG